MLKFHWLAERSSENRRAGNALPVHLHQFLVMNGEFGEPNERRYLACSKCFSASSACVVATSAWPILP
jgi:hypothetical protein